MSARDISVYADPEDMGSVATWDSISYALEGEIFSRDMKIVVATGNGEVPFLPVRGIALRHDKGTVTLVMEL